MKFYNSKISFVHLTVWLDDAPLGVHYLSLPLSLSNI